MLKSESHVIDPKSSPSFTIITHFAPLFCAICAFVSNEHPPLLMTTHLFLYSEASAASFPTSSHPVMLTSFGVVN